MMKTLFLMKILKSGPIFGFFADFKTQKILLIFTNKKSGFFKKVGKNLGKWGAKNVHFEAICAAPKWLYLDWLHRRVGNFFFTFFCPKKQKEKRPFFTFLAKNVSPDPYFGNFFFTVPHFL